MDDPTAHGAGWFAVAIVVPERLADETVGLLAAQGLGATIDVAGAGSSLLRLYTVTRAEAEALVQQARAVLAALGEPAAIEQASIEAVADGRWVERFQAALRPFPLGTRFVVQPAERESAATREPRVPIVLVPGQAFGTGEHPTTRLCAEALERYVRAGSSWLDLGCGTAILAIVARHLGAAEVRALDDDPVAVAVAREVLAANGLDRQVGLGTGSIEAAGASRWDGIVANIERSFFLARAAELAATLRPGGWLVASGFLGEDVAEVDAALGAAGLGRDAVRFSDPWAAIVARREAR